jgi:Uma2 family endonuclease
MAGTSFSKLARIRFVSNGGKAFMIAQTEIYIDAVEHIPENGKLILNNVSWDEYEELITQMESKPGYRMTYDEGRLEIMSPKQDHERPKDFIFRAVDRLAEETDTPLEGFGSTTYRRKRKRKGAEPDLSFYVQNAHLMEGQFSLDLDVDPPPDVVVEIDTTNESLNKFPIYAALGVNEIWLHDGFDTKFYQPVGENYIEIESSIAFPLLTSKVLNEFIERSKSESQTKALKAFRQWVRTNSKT